MVQGKIKSSKQPKKNCEPRKNAPTKDKKKTGSGESINDKIKAKVESHQKKIYKSIEAKIIERAHQSKETFEILKKK